MQNIKIYNIPKGSAFLSGMQESCISKPIHLIRDLD